MKNKITLLILMGGFLLITLQKSIAQTTVIIKPPLGALDDASVASGNPNDNLGSTNALLSMTWTCFSVPCNMSAYMNFDLSSIPSNAYINSAELYLYADVPNAAIAGQPTYGSDNASWVRRVTQSWNESTITWNNQPSSTTQNQATIPQSTSIAQDYVVNVTALVQDMINNPSTSFGFTILEKNSVTYYNSLIFVSNDNADTARAPKLVITYTISNCTNIIIQPDALTGVDATVDSYTPTDDHSTIEDFIAAAWTHSGNPATIRGFINFDLSPIPSTATIQWAYLTLYNNYTSSNFSGSHSHLSGSNAGWVERITSPWQENVNWNNQPAVTNLNRVALPPDTNPHEDYIVNVTAMVQDMINNPGTSHGFRISQQTEQYYRALLFASSDHPNSSLHPKIEICYTDPGSVNDIYGYSSGVMVYPNPASDEIRVESSRFKMQSVKIYDMLGAQIMHHNLNNSTHAIFNVQALPAGIYFVTVQDEKNNLVSRKLIITR